MTSDNDIFGGWCLVCEKATDGSVWCSPLCRQIDISRSQSSTLMKSSECNHHPHHSHPSHPHSSMTTVKPQPHYHTSYPSPPLHPTEINFPPLRESFFAHTWQYMSSTNNGVSNSRHHHYHHHHHHHHHSGSTPNLSPSAAQTKGVIVPSPRTSPAMSSVDLGMHISHLSLGSPYFSSNDMASQTTKSREVSRNPSHTSTNMTTMASHATTTQHHPTTTGRQHNQSHHLLQQRPPRQPLQLIQPQQQQHQPQQTSLYPHHHQHHHYFQTGHDDYLHRQNNNKLMLNDPRRNNMKSAQFFI